ncbi:hypothetical protein NP493_991g00056 [Ridgeia piscesae]|uniref:Sas10 C-terminal domain-containing protein n=1 Tax=Ridgeia piscesae TaxID=27915 RepID=A0AAD9NM06_RIDPI|nr:hypothetical protein NP493_991g00056 [Ridgeia piscesae]
MTYFTRNIVLSCYSKQGAVAVAYDSDDERAYDKEAQPDKGSSEFFHDEVDEFHAGREKILLDSGRNIMPAESSTDEEDVLGVDDDEEDDEDVEMYKAQLSRLRSQGIKEDMGSDLEDDNDEVTDDKAWGVKKSKFYGADVSDEDDVDFSGSEPDTALMEEREALNIQRKMAEQLADEDFGLDIFKDVKKAKQDTTEEETLITKDLSKLTKKEKLQLVKKESPELLEMIEDFKTKLTEVKDRLLPMWKLISAGKLPASNGSEYVYTKLRLYLNYCVNISFYMMLKARRVPVHSHPVIGRLVQYRNLIKQLTSADSAIEREIDTVLQRMEKGEDISTMHGDGKRQKIIRVSTKKKDKPSAKKKLSELVDEAEELETEADVSKEATKGRKGRFETHDEKEALEYYNMMKAGRKRKAEDDEEEEGGESGDEMGADDNEEEIVGNENMEAADGKRGITYQIEKNKGLTPKRNKVNRNPRVKNRMKYRKAKIRRKGQVRPYRPELQRYGGEASGIKAGVIKSVKFK